MKDNYEIKKLYEGAGRGYGGGGRICLMDVQDKVDRNKVAQSQDVYIGLPTNRKKKKSNVIKNLT